MSAAAPAGDPFNALGDPHRRRIVELLVAGGQSVGDIAGALPISRPAVSRHLRLLKDAGLVVEEARGTQRIYRLHDEGVAAVQAYLRQVWGDAAARFRMFTENTGDPLVTDPLRISFDVDRTVEQVFQTWTGNFGQWWPTSHTSSGEDDVWVVFEARLGGRIYERTAAGVTHEWGEITLWEPPRRLGYLWHLRRDRADATEVEIRFVERESGTRIEIEHRGWERLGARGSDWREANKGGWAGLLPQRL